MSAEQLRMNALRVNEAMQRLDKSIEVLGEINLSRIRGMNREELASYRSCVKAARDHVTIAREHLTELEALRKRKKLSDQCDDEAG